MTEPLPVFALHGWALNAAVFDSLRADFAGRRFVAPDLPGHGLRRGERLGRDAGELIDRLLAEAPVRSIWLGWSLGSLLALGAASRAPERIAAMIMVTGAATFMARPGWPQGLPRERLERMAADLARDPVDAVNDFMTLQVVASAAGRKGLRGLKTALAARGRASPEALADGLSLLETMDWRAALAHIRMPVLLVAGAHDRLVHSEAARATAAGLADGRLELFPEAAHAPFLSQPDEFRAVMADFLAAIHDGSR
ncbi:MAG: alpha/beta fold hydrolase [Gammaproteobacteria bacterium]